MALVCSTSSIQYEDFEFIDCSTINVSYAQTGIASVSFSIVSTRNYLINNYTELTLNNVNFKLFVNNVGVSIIPGTLVYVFQMSFIGFGC